MNKSTAVIIMNWNGEKLLRQFLPSVCRNTNHDIADVVVADNGSTDNSLQLLAEEFKQVKVLSFSENYGYAGGYNEAISRLREYKYAVLLNSDVEVTEGWIEPVVEYMQQHEDVMACQPKILSYTDRHRFEYAGAAGGFIDCHGYPYCRGRIFDSIEDDHGQYDGIPADVFWASGAAMFVRTENYLQLGGLDRLFFAHMEEIDLCWRMHLAGGRVVTVPQSVVYHLGGGSLPASNPRKTYLNFRNNLLLMYKNMPVAAGRRMLFVRRLYDALAFCMFVAKLQWGNARAVLKAHRDYRTMKRNYTDFPKENLLGSTPGSDCNIILDYYLRGRRKF